MMFFHFKQFDVKHENSTMKVGSDAVLLGTLAGNFVDNDKKMSILDVGCGCGVISLILAQRFPNAEISAIDIDKNSAEEANFNFQNSPWKNRFSVENISLQNFKVNYENSKNFDFIISNPPYFSNSLKSPSEIKNLAKHKSCLTYDDFCENCLALAKETGIISVILPENEISIFCKSSEKFNLQICRKINVFSKNTQKPKRVILEFILKNDNTNLFPEDNFYIYDNSGQYSREYLDLLREFFPAQY